MAAYAAAAASLPSPPVSPAFSLSEFECDLAKIERFLKQRSPTQSRRNNEIIHKTPARGEDKQTDDSSPSSISFRSLSFSHRSALSSSLPSRTPRRPDPQPLGYQDIHAQSPTMSKSQRQSRESIVQKILEDQRRRKSPAPFLAASSLGASSSSLAATMSRSGASEAYEKAKEKRDEIIERLLEERRRRRDAEAAGDADDIGALDETVHAQPEEPQRQTIKKDKLAIVHKKLAKKKAAPARPATAIPRPRSVPGSPYKHNSFPPADVEEAEAVAQHAYIHSEGESGLNMREKLKAEAEERFQREYPFQPHTNDYPLAHSQSARNINHNNHHNNHHNHNHIDPTVPPSLAMRISGWEAQRAASDHRKSVMAAELDEAELAECTFKPQLNDVRRIPVPPENKENIRVKVYDRPNKVLMREKARAFEESAALSSASFQPAITRKAQRLSDYQPISVRSEEIIKEKERKLLAQRLRAEEKQQTAAPFQPQLNKLSLALAADKEAISATQAQAKAKKAEKAEATQLAECTFAPNIDPVSSMIVSAKHGAPTEAAGQPIEAFLARNERIQDEQRERRRVKQQEESELKKKTYTHKPDIGNAAAILKQAKGDADEPNDAHAGASTKAASKDAFKRMALDDKVKNDLLKQQLALHYASECTFKPAINPISKLIAKPHSITQLTQRTEKPTQAHAHQQHKFQPELNPQSLALVESGLAEPKYSQKDLSSASFLANLAAADVQKARVRRARQQEAEQKQMEECTFQPQISEDSKIIVENLAKGKHYQGVPEGEENKPILIRGLNRYLELKQLAAVKAAEKADRERRVFFSDVTATGIDERTFTIPKPFTFKTAERSAAAEAHAHEQTKDTHSFRPTTVESENRKILEDILREVESQKH